MLLIKSHFKKIKFDKSFFYEKVKNVNGTTTKFIFKENEKYIYTRFSNCD